MLKWIAAAILLLGLSFGQSSTYSSFDAGIRFGLNMPGPEQFLNTSAVGLHAGYWLSPSYRISMNYSSSRLSADEDEYPDLENDHLSLLYFEFSRHQCLGEDFTAYSLIGMGNMMKDDEDQMGFVFGFGIQYPLSRQILLDITLKDHMTEINVPFMSFPDFSTHAQGSGERYVQLTVGLSFAMGPEKTGKGKMRRCGF